MIHHQIKSNITTSQWPITKKCKHQETFLHKAAGSGHAEVVKLLLEHGENIEAKNFIQQTPLHQASYNGYSDVVSELIDNGANVEARDKFERTPL